MALPTRLGEQGFPLASYGTIRVSCDCPPCWGADSFVPARLSDGFGARGVAHLHTHQPPLHLLIHTSSLHRHQHLLASSILRSLSHDSSPRTAQSAQTRPGRLEGAPTRLKGRKEVVESVYTRCHKFVARKVCERIRLRSEKR